MFENKLIMIPTNKSLLDLSYYNKYSLPVLFLRSNLDAIRNIRNICGLISFYYLGSKLIITKNIYFALFR